MGKRASFTKAELTRALETARAIDPAYIVDATAPSAYCHPRNRGISATKWTTGSMVRVNLKGIHRVRMKLADGTRREYHYAWRGKGAPKFWDSASGIAMGSPEYLAALAACAPAATAAKGKFREAIIDFLDSADFTSLVPRTQSDMRKSIFHAKSGIDRKFGSAPIAAFNDPRIRAQALEWRDSTGGKVGDDRIRHLQRIVGFALDRRKIHQNHLRDIKSVYKSNRAEIFWLPDEVEAFRKGAPPHVWRILAMDLETSLRPGDLALLSREHIHRTPHGRRIVIWTQKRKRLASIPVTPRMAQLIDATPDGQIRLIVNKAGQPYKHENYLERISAIKIQDSQPADDVILFC